MSRILYSIGCDSYIQLYGLCNLYLLIKIADCVQLQRKLKVKTYTLTEISEKSR